MALSAYKYLVSWNLYSAFLPKNVDDVGGKPVHVLGPDAQLHPMTAGGVEAANPEGDVAMVAGLAAVHAQRAPSASAHRGGNDGVPAGQRGSAPAGV